MSMKVVANYPPLLYNALKAEGFTRNNGNCY